MYGQDRVRKLLEKSMGKHKTIIIKGGRGAGKTMLAKWYAEQLGAEYYPIETGKIGEVREATEHSYSTSNITLYNFTIGDSMTVQAQNALLKFAEEPPKKAYVCIETVNPNNLLPTIISRSIQYQLDPYTPEEVKKFGTEIGVPDWIAEVCTTPGELMDYAEDGNLENPYNVAKTVVYKVGRASLQNVMTISSKIPKGYEVKFTDFLLHHLGNAKGELNVGYIVSCVNEVVSTRNIMINTNANNTNALDMLLEKLWRLHREWNLHS